MSFLAVLSFNALFAVAFAWTLVWVIERREKKYGLSGPALSDAFLAGALALFFAFLGGVAAMVLWPRHYGTFVVGAATALSGFCLYRESLYKLERRRVTHRLRAEVRLLNMHISKDPSNAAYYVRLAELGEKLGDRPTAAGAAAMAFKLEPTVRNRLRLEQLQGK